MQDQNEDEVIAAIINNPASFYEPDPNIYRIHDYKEYLRNFLADPEDLPLHLQNGLTDISTRPVTFTTLLIVIPSLDELSN